MTTYAYPHEPVPPFVRIGGAITVSSVSKSTGLSEPSSVNVDLAVENVPLRNWLRAGMCWAIEMPDLEDDLWAGFVSAEQLPFQPESFPLSLIGPKEALLEVELANLFPSRVGVSFTVEQVLKAAQAHNSGILPGIIEAIASSVELEVRGEIASGFIDSLQSASALDWRERAVFTNNRLEFLLDFGILQHRRPNIVLGPEDIIAAELVRNRVVSSVTELGASGRFSEREAYNTAALPIGATPPSGGVQIANQKLVDLAGSRNIGPAAVRHAVEVEERVSTRIPEFTRVKHEGMLRGVDEIGMTLDATRADVQSLRLGDVVMLDVPVWVPASSREDAIPVQGEVHIRQITTQDDGTLGVTVTVLH